MKLLTPNEVNTQKTRSDEERESRIKKLSEEESDLITRVNDARVRSEVEIEKINIEFGGYCRVTKLKGIDLDAKIANKTKEVESLELRRVEALSPIEQIRKEAEDRLNVVEIKEANLVEREKELEKAHDNLSVLVEDIADRDIISAERTRELDQRENRVVASENHTKMSAEKVANEWLKFHREVHTANQGLAIREKKVADATKSNNAYAIELSKKETDLMAREIALKDKYETLARSQKEILEGKRDVEKIKSP